MSQGCEFKCSVHHLRIAANIWIQDDDHHAKSTVGALPSKPRRGKRKQYKMNVVLMLCRMERTGRESAIFVKLS